MTTDSLEVQDKGTGTDVSVLRKGITGAAPPKATSEAPAPTEGEGAALLTQEKIHDVETEGIIKHSVICILN